MARPYPFRELDVPPTNVHPLVRWVFEECNRRKVSITQLSKVSGVDRQTIQNWRRYPPRLHDIEACYGMFGKKLTRVDLEET